MNVTSSGILAGGPTTLAMWVLAGTVAVMAAALGNVCSVPLRRLAPLQIGLRPRQPQWSDLAAHFGGSGRTFGGVFAMALATATVGEQLSWGVAGPARIAAWWIAPIFAAAYFLGGVGKGIYRWHSQQIGRHLGPNDESVTRIRLLTPEQRTAVSNMLAEVDQAHPDGWSSPQEWCEAIDAEIGRVLEEYERRRAASPSAGPQEPTAPKRCTRCGKALADSPRFCGHCGQLVARAD